MRSHSFIIRALVAAAVAVTAGCERDTTGLEEAPFPSEGLVFDNAFGAGVGFQAFAGSKTDALTGDPTVAKSGSASLKVTVPGPGDPTGGYAGGAFVASVARDLSGYDALTFWARASRNATLDVAGIGNDNTGTSQYTAQQTGLALTTAWRKYVLPIPLAARLTREAGLFFFAEGPESGAGYEIWFDDIRYERLGTIINPRPLLPAVTVTEEIGSTRTIGGMRVTFDVNGADQTLEVAPHYFTFTSSNPAVAAVSPNGTITTVGAGQATITASLGSVAATGAVTLRAVAPPTAAAPVPTRPAAEVVSLFSGAYTSVPVGTWSASWDQADVADARVAGDDVKKYTNLVFAGIEFTSPTVDASAMTHLHLDVWTYDASNLRVKLVDFGADGAFGGGDDSEHEVALSGSSTPPLTAGAWSSLDLPLSAFGGLAARGHLAQLILVGTGGTVYLDNLYFYQEEVVAPTEPTVAAPTPTYAADDVIALFSNAYAARPVDTWSASWDQADVADVSIAGDDVKKYTDLVFAGIEFTSAPIDASAMTSLRLDLWTPGATDLPAQFRIKLVDFGANGVWGGGDDVEHEVALTASTTPGLATGSWVTLDVPLSAFTGLTTRGHLAQLIISGDLRTVFVDNVLLHR